MSLDKYIENTFPISCKELKDGVDVNIIIYQRYGNNTNIQSVIECPYNDGPHGELCRLIRNIKGKNYCKYIINV